LPEFNIDEPALKKTYKTLVIIIFRDKAILSAFDAKPGIYAGVMEPPSSSLGFSPDIITTWRLTPAEQNHPGIVM
jgi:hypothetical protein